MKQFRSRKGRGSAVRSLLIAPGLTLLLLSVLAWALSAERLRLEAALRLAPLLPLPGCLLGCLLAGKGGSLQAAVPALFCLGLWLLAGLALGGAAGQRWVPPAVCGGAWLAAVCVSALRRGGQGSSLRKRRL